MSPFVVLLTLLLGLLGFSGPDAHGAPNGDVTVNLDPSSNQGHRLTLPPVTGARGSNRPIVVIDPGHGGRDPGATSPIDGREEKDITLAIARAIRDELASSGRVRVALTRDDDRYLVHHDRFEIARELGAGLFISVHVDAAANPEARGATIYSLSEVASDKEAAALAARENQSDLVAGVDIGGKDPEVKEILIDLALRESMDVSADFARLLYREASPLMLFRPQHHRFASLLVLKAPDIPSILFESGYLTNKADLAFIESPEGRHRIAVGMRRAIETYFARRLVAAGQRQNENRR